MEYKELLAKVHELANKKLSYGSCMSPQDAVEVIQGKLCGEDVESMVVIYLNSSNKILETMVVSGQVDRVIIYPRNIIKKALLLEATGIIIAHNHPSNEIQPSVNDISLTNKIQDGAKIFDIELHDHIIVSDKKEYFSFADENMI